MPEISVIMGVYNQFNRQILEASVDSVLNQTYKDLEFIIYDDGSAKEVTEILEEIAKKDERIVLFGAKENHGLAFSLNACIRKAKGKYIARMDCDDISYPERLQAQREFLEENPEFSFVGCNADLFDEGGVWGVRKMPERPSESDFLKYSPYIHPSVMYRANLFTKEIAYDESSEMLRCEDYEIFMKLKSKGYSGANLQKQLFAYREDVSAHARRTMKHRINEAKCRYRNFKKLGILFPKGWIYVLRPIVGGIIPTRVRSRVKRKESAKQ